MPAFCFLPLSRDQSSAQIPRASLVRFERAQIELGGTLLGDLNG